MSTEALTYHPAARREEVPAGRLILRTVGSYEVLICRIEDQFFAIENKCSHMNKPLDKGRVIGSQLICPFHSGCFDLRTGAPQGFPANRPLRCFPVRLSGDMIEIGDMPIIGT